MSKIKKNPWFSGCRLGLSSVVLLLLGISLAFVLSVESPLETWAAAKPEYDQKAFSDHSAMADRNKIEFKRALESTKTYSQNLFQKRRLQMDLLNTRIDEMKGSGNAE